MSCSTHRSGPYRVNRRSDQASQQYRRAPLETRYGDESGSKLVKIRPRSPIPEATRHLTFYAIDGRREDVRTSVREREAAPKTSAIRSPPQGPWRSGNIRY